MKAFPVAQWETNPAADKICSELFTGNNTSTRRKQKNKKSEIKHGNIKKSKLKKQQRKQKEGSFIVKNTISNTANNANLTDIYTKKESNKQRINKLKVKRKSENIGVQQSQNPNHVSPKSDKNKKKKSENIGVQQSQNPNHVSPKSDKNKKRQSENIGIQQKQNTLHLSSKKVKNKKKKFENIGVQQRQNTHYLQSNNDNNKEEKKEKHKIVHQKHKERSKQSRNVNESFSPSTPKTNNKMEKGNFNKKKKRKESNDMSEHQMLEPESHTSVSKTQKQMQRYSNKLQNHMKQKHSSTLNKKQMAALPLRERMVEKLKAARFRYLNEQMYTSMGKDAQTFFQSDANAYVAYHEGYRQQVARWPLNPLNIIIEKIRKLPHSYVIADFGCGEASLAQSVPHTVHSFDLVAVNEHVTACDMAHVSLENNSVNVAVFCLSLMGTNLKDYLLEANRVLKLNGLLMIAEVESRFETVDTFIKNVQSFGFIKTRKDLSHDLFCFLDFVKKDSKLKQKSKLPDVSLNPCLYKRR